MAAFSAKNARIKYGANSFLLATKWTINTKVDELDYTNFESAGYAIYTGGVWDADISFDAFYDSLLGDPFTTFVPGNTTGPFYFYLANTAAAANVGMNVTIPPVQLATYWFFPSLLFTSVNMDTEVKGFIRYTVSAKPGETGWTMP